MVLILATSNKTRGGITSVLQAHKKTHLWQKWQCRWVETHIDKGVFLKIFFLIKAVLRFFILIPFTRIVHVHLSGPISVKRKLIFVWISKLLSKKIIIHLHAFSENSSLDPKFHDLYKKVFDLSNQILVLSNNWKSSLINDFNINPENVDVLYNPCPTRQKDKLIEKKDVIIYAGTLNKRKNYETLLKAFPAIVKKYPSWKIVFAGNGEITKAMKIAASLQIENNVEFVGWVSGHRKHELFSSGSIFCLPSYAEGFPMAVLDAWSHGLPVVTTPVGGIPDIAEHEQNLMLFEPDDINKLTENLFKVIEDRQLNSLLSKESFKFSQGKFNATEVANKLDTIYRKVLS